MSDSIDEEIVDVELYSPTPTNRSSNQSNNQSTRHSKQASISDDSEIVFNSEDSDYVEKPASQSINESISQSHADSNESTNESPTQYTISRLLCQSGSSILAAAEYMGEGFASLFGITDSRYQYVIDAQQRMERQMEMEEAEEAEAAKQLQQVINDAHQRFIDDQRLIEEGESINGSTHHQQYDHLSSNDQIAELTESPRLKRTND